MATFASATFNTAAYASFRPTYPPKLLNLIYAYHSNGGKRTGCYKRAVDIGCGTGQFTQDLPELFSEVTGTDSSQKMVAQAAAEAGRAQKAAQLKYVVSGAEEVASHFAPNSVDLVTAAQAAHWFDHQKLWPALATILKPGGTAALWGYSEFRLDGHPEITPLVNQYSKGDQSLGPYWEQPGRGILDNHFLDIAFPSTPEWAPQSAQRLFFSDDYVDSIDDLPRRPLQVTDDPSSRNTVLPSGNFRTETILKKTLTWEGMDAYLRTWSCLHNYHEKYPADKERRGKVQDGDIVDRYIALLKEKLPNTETLQVVWPLALMLIKKAE